MKFKVLPNSTRIPIEGESICYLWEDNWNDWWEYSTLYVLVYFDEHGEKHRIGGVKIGQFGMRPKQLRADLPLSFDQLSSQFFSLGQDEDYYDEISKLSEQRGDRILSALNDIVLNDELFRDARKERVTGVSLMRYVDERTILGQFRRILTGGLRLTPFSFRYIAPKQSDARSAPVELDFKVFPNSNPPTNVHVIIGSNGVGKSYMLNSMSRALIESNESVERIGAFINESNEDYDTNSGPFANLVSVSFSAFDEFPRVRFVRNRIKAIKYTAVGLKMTRRKSQKVTDQGQSLEAKVATQAPGVLTQEFIDSTKACMRGQHRRERWRRALRTLESDSILHEADVTALLDEDINSVGSAAGRIFRGLSSGHKIVLLTITKLVEHVEERTLVLMDEPETHLHPPFLSAFVRAVSDLLINRNGIAIIATHSPVVLQEVPSSCVWKLRRHGNVAVAERPLLETFAENVGRLTHEVFGLEVTRSGFHRLLASHLGSNDSFETVMDRFEREVGSEGRALIAALIAERDSRYE